MLEFSASKLQFFAESGFRKCAMFNMGGNMKYLLLSIILLLVACDKPPKIAATQREALDKAKGVEQVIKKDAEEMKQKVEDAAN